MDKEFQILEWRDILDVKDKSQKIGVVRIQLLYIYSEEIHLKNKIKEIENKIEKIQNQEILPK